MKKSATEDQVLDLNRVDFERAGTGRKAGYKFVIEFTDGKVGNVISGSALAMHLASVIMEDDNAKQILKENNYEVSLNTKFQLSIKNVTPAHEGKPGAKKATMKLLMRKWNDLFSGRIEIFERTGPSYNCRFSIVFKLKIKKLFLEMNKIR